MAQKFLSIKNFEKYQHFKKAMPPWIKLYRSMFGDRDFMGLPIPSRYLYIGLIMLASEGCNRVANDPPWIAQRLAISPSDIDLKPLYKSGLLIASESSVRRYTEESETEKRRDREEEIPQAPLREAVSNARGKTIFPEEWKLTEEDKAGWLRFGLNASVEFASFRDHALANDRRCANWPAAFRNWCRKSLALKERQYVPKVQ